VKNVPIVSDQAVPITRIAMAHILVTHLALFIEIRELVSSAVKLRYPFWSSETYHSDTTSRTRDLHPLHWHLNASFKRTFTISTIQGIE